MQFTVKENSSQEEIWKFIFSSLAKGLQEEVSAATSTFIKTADGLECNVRRSNGSLIASCYSESDRMGNRRWSIQLAAEDKQIT